MELRAPLLILLCFLVSVRMTGAAEPTKPNIICILADELGHFEPGFMGGKLLQTPQLDRMAREGVIFRHMLSGGPNCAPARATLLTGKHTGHAAVRDNNGNTPLRADDATLASMLKSAGYATGGFGKWGIGARGSTGVPEQRGFDVFFGYYDQVHAHTYYPPYLIRNSAEVPLPGNKGGKNGPHYSMYRIHDEAKQFIRAHAKEPFFAYLPYIFPHGPFAIPESDASWRLFKDQPWPEEARLYAAMTHLLDRYVGEIRALLEERGLAENTVIMFSGDNGGSDRFADAQHPRGLFSANKDPRTGTEYRGGKGSLYEGAFRVPFFVWGPGRVRAGHTSEHVGYFPDVMPTLAELAGLAAPKGSDGVSFAPELSGKPQPAHEFLYWERGDNRAIRQGQWRAVKTGRAAAWELYDVSRDPAESKDLAAQHPAVVEKLAALATKAHTQHQPGTFTTKELMERDRRAKTGKQDQAKIRP